MEYIYNQIEGRAKRGAKKAWVERIPVVDTTKFAAGPDNFDKSSRWGLLEPLVAALEPKCEDPSLVDPTTSKSSEGKELIIEKNVNYENKFKRLTFEIKSKNIKYIDKAILDKKILLSIIKFTEKY